MSATVSTFRCEIVVKLQARSGKRVVKVSKCGETYIEFYKLYDEYDPFLATNTCENNSPWLHEVGQYYSLADFISICCLLPLVFMMNNDCASFRICLFYLFVCKADL